MKSTPLSLIAQTAFAQVVEVALSADVMRSVSDLPGSFIPKTIKERKYWYYQFSEPSGARRQLFVGPDNDAVRALVAKSLEASSSESLGPLVRSAVALGNAQVLPRHFKVLRRLADYGFFRAGGVLIGTHAFLSYGNMLGLKWGVADASMTHDIDFAHAGKNISLALNAGMTVQTHEAIQSLEMGFLPVSGLGGKTGGAYLIPNEKEFRLDFLTPVGRDGEVPYEHPDLHVTLQPLKFMEYSLENVQQSALICGNQAVIVNVPHPARYALHKLIVVTLREGAFQIKTHKDLMQAGMLLSALKATRPWEVEDAWEDLISRGKGWSSRAGHGMKQLCRMFPEEAFDQWLSAP